MSYISISFAILVAVSLIIYYCIPGKYRWYVLLASSLVFYILSGKLAVIAILVTASLAYVMARLAGKSAYNTKLLWASILLILLPWITVRALGLSIFSGIFPKEISILGISFYSLELISYITDVYKGKIEAETNYLRFLTYALFFPKIMQGPICRYEELSPKLFKESSFDSKKFSYGFMEIIFGAFLKFLIADKCRLIADPVFDNFIVYDGLDLWIALFLFLVILYTDFLACVMICKGVSSMFGIDLFMNFKRPMLATSFKQFWQRWHISLSKWLSDYIYIPLGGNKKGQVRRLINLLVTFLVSALWHGSNSGFLMWGLLQVIYRMTEEVTLKGRKANKYLGRFKVCFLYGISMAFFNLPTAKEGFDYIRCMFHFTGIRNFLAIGLINHAMGYKEFLILIISILLLVIKELANEAGVNFKKVLIEKPFIIRLLFYLIAIMTIVSFGTYGYGFNSADFIYGGF
ncbi:MAG: hypothetical protein MJ123_08135 [Lachnospiraceae bacterium]|nr:hypothetical protein [Lachnospiraceae bacterium]